MPTDLWVPVTSKIKPMQAHQYSLGSYYTGLPGWEFSVEGYYKQIKDIADNLSIPVPVDWFQTLLRMPDVMTKTEIQELTEEEWETVHVAIEEAIKHLVDFRKQEGACLLYTSDAADE